MSAHEKERGDHGPEAPHTKPTDINFRAILISGAILVALTVLAIVASRYFGDFLDTERKGAVRGPQPLPGAPQVRPEPHLQRAPADDLARLRREEEAVLGAYRINRETGIVQIPIERAMEVLAREGLPARPESPEMPEKPLMPEQPEKPKSGAEKR